MNQSTSDDFIIITGGPGSGKTTLLHELRKRGFATMPEAGRSIIQVQLAIGGHALPWIDREAFANQMLGWELRSHDEARKFAGRVFFDRALPDIAGYLALSGLEIGRAVEQAISLYRYHRTVFIAPPWRDIFVNDAERKQDFDESVATYEAMVKAYGDAGYELVDLPLVPVAERADFLIEKLG